MFKPSSLRAGILRADFGMFVPYAFKKVHDKSLGEQKYLLLMIYAINRLLNRKTRRLLINLPPQPLGEKREADVGANAVAVGGRQLDGAAERDAGNDDLRGFERRGGRRAHAVQQRVEQRLETVGKLDVQHCCRFP